MHSRQIALLAQALIFVGWFTLDTLRTSLGTFGLDFHFYDMAAIIASPRRLQLGVGENAGIITVPFAILCLAVVLAPAIVPRRYLIVARLAPLLLMLACGFFGVGSPQIWSVSQTLSGSAAAGRWAGIKNFFGNLAGIAAPALTGIIVGRTGHFFWAFLLTSAVALSGSLIWIFVVGSVEPVVWAD